MLLIRPITLNDFDEVSALIREVADKYLYNEFTEEGKHNFLKSVTGEGLVNNVNNGFEYSVALEDNEIVAVIAFKNISHLYNLFVKEDFQGRGIGRALWEEATKNKKVAKHTVFASSYAEPIYKKLGFVRSGEPSFEGGIYCIPMTKVN